jgi:hypothetical protein
MKRSPGGSLTRQSLCLVLPAAIFAVVLGGASSAPVRAAQCGTALLFEPGKGLRAGLKTGAQAGRAAADNRARTLVSDHFLIHYSLRAWHRVRTGPEDSSLVRASDSLYALLSDLPEAKRDSAVYARLDSAGFPHPAYVSKTRDLFEAARAYYVDRLGMSAPVSAVRSSQYNVPPSLPKLFPIDVVDVGTTDPFFAGETYGVTYPPSALSISFENDFICRTSLDLEGRIRGDSIKSRLAGAVIHNYAAEWDLGIKVTAFHEFYHAVQFTYVPRITSYHAWYEISATGMEERNAGEVNDYLQYLPCVLGNHDRVPLTSTLQGPCTHYPMYGQAIFHQYLTVTLDSLYDVRVWDQLSRNRDELKDGLETAFGKYGKSMAVLYPDYAAQLLFAGRRFHPPAGLFSPDVELWPGVSMDSVDLSGPLPNRVITVPALTFAVLKVKRDADSPERVLQAQGIAGISRIHADAASSLVERLPGTRFALGPARDGYQAYYLVLPNPSFTDNATVQIKDMEDVFYAYPNPVHALSQAWLFFSQKRGMGFPSRVRIYGENGRIVRTLDFTGTDALAWDLKDARNLPVKAGVYYYRLAEEPLKTVVILR